MSDDDLRTVAGGYAFVASLLKESQEAIFAATKELEHLVSAKAKGEERHAPSTLDRRRRSPAKAAIGARRKTK